MKEPTEEQLRAIIRLQSLSDFTDGFMPWLREAALDEMQRAVGVRGPERDEAIGGFGRLDEVCKTVDGAETALTAQLADKSDSANDGDI